MIAKTAALEAAISGVIDIADSGDAKGVKAAMRKADRMQPRKDWPVEAAEAVKARRRDARNNGIVEPGLVVKIKRLIPWSDDRVRLEAARRNHTLFPEKGLNDPKAGRIMLERTSAFDLEKNHRRGRMEGSKMSENVMSRDPDRKPDAPLWYRLAYQELMQAERDGIDPSVIAEALEELGEYLELRKEFDPSLNGLYESVSQATRR